MAAPQNAQMRSFGRRAPARHRLQRRRSMSGSESWNCTSTPKRSRRARRCWASNGPCSLVGKPASAPLSTSISVRTRRRLHPDRRRSCHRFALPQLLFPPFLEKHRDCRQQLAGRSARRAPADGPCVKAFRSMRLQRPGWGFGPRGGGRQPRETRRRRAACLVSNAPPAGAVPASSSTESARRSRSRCCTCRSQARPVRLQHGRFRQEVGPGVARHRLGLADDVELAVVLDLADQHRLGQVVVGQHLGHAAGQVRKLPGRTSRRARRRHRWCRRPRPPSPTC
jgi:hypothetical protein